ncbi:MAG: MFS transporter [Alphaproteobacteria bacterium]|nr:MFS transporter [Alphaproteobacteria bacterium]
MTPALSLPRIVLQVLVPFAAGYVMTWLLRSVNAVVAPDLVRELGLTASGLGLLTSAYFFTYAAMQLPVGLLLDRYGPRRTQAGLFVFTAFGCLGFALAEDELTLTLSRALIGLGLAGGLMAGFKTVALWLPRDKVPMGNGCYMAVGALGAILAATPTSLLVQAIGWRPTFALLGAVMLAVAAAIHLIVPERGGGGRIETLPEQLRGLAGVVRDRLFWKVTPLVSTTNAVALAVQSLWLGPWLIDVGGLTRVEAANYLMVCSLGFGIGVAGIGTLATWLGRRGIDTLTVLTFAVLPFLGVQAVMVLGWTTDALILLVLLYGMTGQVAIVVHAKFAEHFGIALAGRASTALNLVAFVLAFASQYLVGGIIDLWPPGPDGGYHPDGYRAAFAGALAIQVASYVWYLAVRERR